MAELVDAADLKSVEHSSYGFDSRLRYLRQIIKPLYLIVKGLFYYIKLKKLSMFKWICSLYEEYKQGKKFNKKIKEIKAQLQRTKDRYVASGKLITHGEGGTNVDIDAICKDWDELSTLWVHDLWEKGGKPEYYVTVTGDSYEFKVSKATAYELINRLNLEGSSAMDSVCYRQPPRYYQMSK